MKIELNDTAICDEILALTALRSSSRRDNMEETAMLTRDCLPGLRNMVRMMFADTVVQLHGYVRGCGLDESDPSPSLPYGGDGEMRLMVELETGIEPSSGMALAMKRTLEHVVASKVLEAVAGAGDHDFADSLRAQYQVAVEALRHTLDGMDMECVPPAVAGHRF